MIEVGDLVRIKNKHLKASGFLFNRTRYKRPYRTFRGKQVIAKVVRVISKYDWRTRRMHTVVILDIPDPRPLPSFFTFGRERPWMLDASYLVVHRKAKTNGAVTVT